MPFVDRVDAGRKLAERLGHLRGQDVVVLGLPRSGVAVAYEVARALDAPLDVLVVRKLGVPDEPELAMGAVGEDGAALLSKAVIRSAHVSEAEVAEVERQARMDVRRRALRFRRDRARLSLTGRTALLVDDGIATGSTALVACEVARKHGAARVVVAVPVCSSDSVRAVRRAADELVFLEVPESLAVGQMYADFRQTSDEEVIHLLRAAARAALEPRAGENASGDAAAALDEEFELVAGGARLSGHLAVPPGAKGLVLFVHGSGSSRHSPRNQYVAAELRRAGIATLLFDLLTSQEEQDRANVFDVERLAGRLADVTAWARRACGTLPVDYFGGGTGAAPALWAAADDLSVAAVVCRGGRLDLAAPRLGHVAAPTLLVVGGRDTVVLEHNKWAQACMRCEVRLAVVAGATHLFEEPGTLEQAAALARDWCLEHLLAAPLRSA